MTILDKVFLWLGHGRYWATPAAASDGDAVALLVDNIGQPRVRVAGGPLITGYVQALAAAANGVVLAAPCKLVYAHGFNKGSGALYVGLYNRTTVPSGSGVAPLRQFLVPAGGSFSFFPPEPITYGTGLVWAASSAAGEWSSPGGSDICITVAYQ